MKIEINENLNSNTPVYSYNTVVKYGIPKTSNTRKILQKNTNQEKDAITNASILYIQEKGSKPKKIPPRPLLEPVRQKHQEYINEEMKKVLAYLVVGDKENADAILDKLAFYMETATKAFFTSPDNNWAPNAPSTIRQKKGKDTPLINTGELRKSIRGLCIKE